MKNDITSTVSLSFGKLLKYYLIIGISVCIVALLFLLLAQQFLNPATYHLVLNTYAMCIQKDFLIYVLVGFAAQMIDGSLGMAYGVSSTTFLMNAGISPLAASASVHVAEVFTTGISGISHYKLGNVDKAMFKKLLLPGALGAAIGAFVLSSFDGAVLKPYISVYLLIMGVIILLKAFKKTIHFKENKGMGWLALVGGFVDASGGGGWGPVVTTTLIGNGNNPKLTIGTVNAVEFLVTLTASGIFTMTVGLNNWQIIAGLIAGGAIAAPLAALICHKINIRSAIVLVGLLIITLSIRTLLKTFHII